MVCFIMYKKLFHLVLFILISISLRAQAAVILQYHHVSETLPAEPVLARALLLST